MGSHSCFVEEVDPRARRGTEGRMAIWNRYWSQGEAIGPRWVRSSSGAKCNRILIISMQCRAIGEAGRHGRQGVRNGSRRLVTESERIKSKGRRCRARSEFGLTTFDVRRDQPTSRPGSQHNAYHRSARACPAEEDSFPHQHESRTSD